MREAINPPLLSKIARQDSLLRAILDGHQEKRELEAVLDLSRSTIDRVVRDLSSEGIIIRESGRYSVTLYGRLALEEYERLRTRYQTFNEAKSLLTTQDSEHPFTPSLLQNAEVIRAKQPAPHAPINHLDQLLEQCDSIRAVLPVVPPRFEEAFCDRILEGRLDARLVFEDDVVQYLFEASRERLELLLDTENATIRRIDENLPFGFVIIDQQTLWLAFYDEEGSLKGAIVNDTEQAVGWAHDMFQSYCGRATVEVRRGSGSFLLHT